MINILMIGKKCKKFSEAFLGGLSEYIYFSDKEINISDGQIKKYCIIDVLQTDFTKTRFFDIIILKNNDFKPFYPNDYLRKGGLVFMRNYNKSPLYLSSPEIQCINFGSSEYDTVTYTSLSTDSLRVSIQRPITVDGKMLEIQEFNVNFKENGNLYAALCSALTEKIANICSNGEEKEI